MEVDIDIKELEAFVYVLENCSFSKAAELLHLTQPTISSHISALERKLGIKLVVRTTKETYPSDAGKLLYRYAKEILQLRENAAVALREFSQDMRGNVSITASSIPGQHYLPAMLQNFREKYPDITFSIQIEPSRDVMESIGSRAADIGFCSTRVLHHKCIAVPFVGDRMVLITPNTEEYQSYAGKTFPASVLAKETLICCEKSSDAYQITLNVLRYLGVNVSAMPMVEVRSSQQVKERVSQGLGVGIVSRNIAQDYAQRGQILMFPLDSEELCRQLYIVKHKNNILSPAAQAFYDYACEYYKKS